MISSQLPLVRSRVCDECPADYAPKIWPNQKKMQSFGPQLLSGWCQPESRFQIGNSSIRTCLLKYSQTALGGGSTTQFEKYLGQNVWKICIFPKLKLSEHHLVSSFFKLIPNQPNQPNNPTQPHSGKPRPVQVHNHQISNHHPKWRALKIPVLDHISISKR